jgi:Spy/CpxP family protein refolding chaperone
MMSIHQAENDRFEALLTPDQKSKYEAMEAQRRSRMHGEHGGPPAGEMAPPPPPPGGPQS